MNIETGDRIGKTAKLSVAVNGIIRDKLRILMVRRSDNGKWGLPGGRVEPGESIAEAVVRETLEETGLETEVCGLSGVYSNPDVVYAYADGNRWQAVEIDLELKFIMGELRASEETTEFKYVGIEDLNDPAGFMECDIPRLLDILEEYNYAY